MLDRMLSRSRLGRVFTAYVKILPTTQLHGLRVLIIEDARLLAAELEAGLSQAGAQILGPVSGLDLALAAIARRPDAVVLTMALRSGGATSLLDALHREGLACVLLGDDPGLTVPVDLKAIILSRPYDIGHVAQALADIKDLA
jgi:DNA-binding NarL/FixJ family response regulator